MNTLQTEGQQHLVFDNVWRKDDYQIKRQVLDVWQTIGLQERDMTERINQLVYVVKNEAGEVVGISTAFKTYIKQLRGYFYAFRCMVVPEFRVPGLDSKLVVETRDFLESIHEQDGPEKALGVITLVENENIKKYNTKAIWTASSMVFIGYSKEGHHIRVYYFKGARIQP
jgi:hypothetical protein